MIHPDVLMGPFDGRDWANLVALFMGRRAAAPKRKTLFLLHRQGLVLKAYHSERGALRNARPDIGRLEDAAREHDAELVVCLTPEDLAAIFARAESSFDPEADYVEQMISLVQNVKSEMRERVVYWPGPPIKLKDVSYQRVRRVFERLWPDNRSLGLFVLEDDLSGVHASLILTKESGEITEMANADALDLEGEALGDLKRAHEVIVRAMEERQRRPWLVLITRRSTFVEMRNGKRVLGFLALARRRGAAIIKPYPLKLRLLLAAARLLGR